MQAKCRSWEQSFLNQSLLRRLGRSPCLPPNSSLHHPCSRRGSLGHLQRASEHSVRSQGRERSVRNLSELQRLLQGRTPKWQKNVFADTGTHKSLLLQGKETSIFMVISFQKAAFPFAVLYPGLCAYKYTSPHVQTPVFDLCKEAQKENHRMHPKDHLVWPCRHADSLSFSYSHTQMLIQ